MGPGGLLCEPIAFFGRSTLVGGDWRGHRPGFADEIHDGVSGVGRPRGHVVYTGAAPRAQRLVLAGWGCGAVADIAPRGVAVPASVCLIRVHEKHSRAGHPLGPDRQFPSESILEMRQPGGNADVVCGALAPVRNPRRQTVQDAGLDVRDSAPGSSPFARPRLLPGVGVSHAAGRGRRVGRTVAQLAQRKGCRDGDAVSHGGRCWARDSPPLH